MANELINQLITVTVKSGGATPLADINGNNLAADYTFCYYGCFCPYYSSVRLIRLNGGPFLNAISDEIISLTILEMSCMADIDIQSDCGSGKPENKTLLYAKIRYVTLLTLIELLTRVRDKFSGGKSKKLADLAISYQGQTIDQRMLDANKDIDYLRRYLQSCGGQGRGTSVKPCIAAKGSWRADEPWIGRGWIGTGPLNAEEDRVFSGIVKNRPNRFFNSLD